MKPIILNPNQWHLEDEDVKLSYQIACEDMNVFYGNLNADVKFHMSEILDTEPWVIQAWIDSKSPEEISDLLFSCSSLLFYG